MSRKNRGPFSNATGYRSTIKRYYDNKYFNLFVGSRKFTLSDEQSDYLMRRMWYRGSIACIKLRGVTDDNPEALVFADYAPSEYNIYDFPVRCRLINKRNVPFIPNRELMIHKEVVIGYVNAGKQPVYDLISPLINELVETWIALRQNIKAMKVPFLFATSPESETKMKQLFDMIEEGDASLFLSVEDIKNISVFNSGTNPVFDKLLAHISALDQEILKRIGMNSLGIAEKKEHLITAEIDASDDEVYEHSGQIDEYLEKFFDEIYDVLGVAVGFTPTVKRETKEESKDEGATEDEGN